MIRTTQFDRYVALADEGRRGLPWLLLGALAILLLWVLATLLVIVGFSALGRLVRGDDMVGISALLDIDLESRFALFPMLGAVAVLWPVMALVLPLVHRRRLGTIFGWTRRIAVGDFARAFVAACLVALLFVGLLPLYQVPIARTGLPLTIWLAWAIPVIVMVFLQATAEELLFRGYLPQALANRLRSPLVWAVLPLLLFTVLHWDPAAVPHMRWAALSSILFFAVAATVLVVRTGNLGAAMGLHVANNLVAFLCFAPQGGMEGFALYSYPALSDESWQVMDAVFFSGAEFISTATITVLLLLPGSPLRIGAKSAEMAPMP